MKANVSILLLFLLLLHNSFAQTKTMPGSYTLENGEKHIGLIKYEDWNRTPSRFEFKSSEDQALTTIHTDDVKEIVIDSVAKYQRSFVAVDQSGQSLGDLDANRNPVFKQENVLLKVLVEGEATLYADRRGNHPRYFYKIGDANTEQLIYKEYLTANGKVAENQFYKQQLLTDLKCSDISRDMIEETNYKEKELTQFFVAYNTCSGGPFQLYQKKKNKASVRLNLRPGLTFSSLEYTSPAFDADFGAKEGFRIGAELEAVLPFYNNKWALILEPTFRAYQAEMIQEDHQAEVTYNSVEVPFGIRHYFFLTTSNKLFINASYMVDFPLNSTLNLVSNNVPHDSKELKKSANAAFGIGYAVGSKLQFELRYHTPRDVRKTRSTLTTYNNFSLILGYTVF